MSAKITVALEKVAQELEGTSEFSRGFLNTATGEFVTLFTDHYLDEENMALGEEIDASNDYVRLPDQGDIDEYSIMEDFAEATPHAGKRGQLFRALNGRKPFRSFKDALYDTGLDEAYYAYRFLALIDIAKAWCEENSIPYTE